MVVTKKRLWLVIAAAIILALAVLLLGGHARTRQPASAAPVASAPQTRTTPTPASTGPTVPPPAPVAPSAAYAAAQKPAVSASASSFTAGLGADDGQRICAALQPVIRQLDAQQQQKAHKPGGCAGWETVRYKPGGGSVAWPTASQMRHATVVFVTKTVATVRVPLPTSARSSDGALNVLEISMNKIGGRWYVSGDPSFAHS